MEKIWIVTQQSNCDGEIIVNVTPCADEHSAKAIMDEEIRTLLSEEHSKYFGLDLDEAEKRTQDEDDWDNDFNVERTEDHTYITCNVDNYYEYIDIEEKAVMTINR